MEIAAQLKTLLEGLSGVRDAILCSADGRPFESIGIATSVAEAAVLTASIASELSRVGELLALGALDKAVMRAEQGIRVVAREEQTLAAVTLEPKRPTAELDSRLATRSRAERKPPAGAPRAVDPTPVPREPVFGGQLELFCLPDLLEFLRAGQRTGKLRLDGSAGAGSVRMRRGKITAALSPNTGTMGDYLVKHAVVTGEQLRGLLQEQRSDARRSLGRLSIDRRLATAADVRRALVAQVQDTIRELKDWTTGTFAFEPEPITEPTTLSEIEIELDPQAVLLTIFKEEDEAHEGSRQAAGADAVW